MIGRAVMLALLLASPLAAQVSADRDQGLAVWGDIFAVASHPRCTNCHVAADAPPMWNGLGYGADVAHGMNIRAGDSRVGAETAPCRTCHFTVKSANDTPHAPPMINDAWRLPPPELAWLGKSSVDVCTQLRDPERNNSFAADELSTHLETSPFVAWGFDPGAGRSTPPGSLADLVAALEIWVAAGTPCDGID